ncbi:MAG: glycosyltransferase family 4 protein [Gemmatimonadota bacterium]|nr:glycosyltransferase family 4 protein [Gemmatimonadota bacterium]
MRLQHIATEDITGGAARCAYRLHQALRDAGVDSRMLVRRKASDDPTVQAFRPSPTVSARLRRRLRRWRIRRALQDNEDRRSVRYEPFHGDLTESGPELLDWVDDEAHVVHLHWVSRFLDYPSVLPELARRGPVVWTLHDMNMFTGGCHYDDGCGRYTLECGRCPQLDSNEESDPSRGVWRRKRTLFSRLSKGRLHFVTPSQWLARELRASGIVPEDTPISVIPYGVDTATFRPIPVAQARDSLGLPPDKKAVLFVAESVESRRKGFGELRATLPLLDRTDDFLLLSLGKGQPSFDLDIEHHHLGFVKDDERLATVYSAADVFAMPSQEDNLPATVLESLACGTPVVAFDTGGLPDMVRPGVTGALAPLGDRAAFARRLRAQLDASPTLRNGCRTVAEQEYSLDRQAERYMALYESVLDTPSPAAPV